jgi:hypothetical protein
MNKNCVEISIKIIGYEELIEKLEKIKELLNDIKNTKLEVKQIT